jgi:RNA polymerase sigma-70 factor (ECF subfamily)
MAEARSQQRARDEARSEMWDEAAVIRRAAAGDHEAFAALVHAYEGGLLAYLAQMLGDTECACDIAQETFLAAYQVLPRWRAPERPQGAATPVRLLAPWLYRIATNRALSLLRAQPLAGRPESLDAHHNPWPEPVGVSLEEQTVARDLLHRALCQLSDEDAACLVLYYVAGERYGEMPSDWD